LLPAVSRKILEYLDKIDEKSGRAKKMDLLRIAGNETILTGRTEYLIGCNIITEVQENGKRYFIKTDVGQKLHEVLKLHPYVGTLFEDLGRMRRRRKYA